MIAENKYVIRVLTARELLLIAAARQMRLEAETTNDPELYRKAAAAFMALDMQAAAARMTERAEYYAIPKV